MDEGCWWHVLWHFEYNEASFKPAVANKILKMQGLHICIMAAVFTATYLGR